MKNRATRFARFAISEETALGHILDNTSRARRAAIKLDEKEGFRSRWLMLACVGGVSLSAMAGCASQKTDNGEPDPFGPRYCCVAQSPDGASAARAPAPKPGG